MAVKDKTTKKKHWTQEEFDAWVDSLPICNDDPSPETLAAVNLGLEQIEAGKFTRVKNGELDKFLESL